MKRNTIPLAVALAAVVASALSTHAATNAANGSLDLARLRNPVWSSVDNLRDPSVLKVPGGYRLFYSRLTTKGNWGEPQNWAVAEVFTRDFIRFENDRNVSPKGHASPGDVVEWHGRFILPYQTYPSAPTQLCFSESPDLLTWSAPKPFLIEARFLPWNSLKRVIDPTLVLDGETLHCFFVGSANVTNAAGKTLRANLLGHALTRDPQLAQWEILSTNTPLAGRLRAGPGRRRKRDGLPRRRPLDDDLQRRSVRPTPRAGDFDRLAQLEAGGTDPDCSAEMDGPEIRRALRLARGGPVADDPDGSERRR